MSKRNRFGICVVLMLVAGLAGCNGKPEDTGQGAASEDVKTPAPPYPAWATAMLGRGLKEVTRGTTSCKGQIDVVSVKHTGVRPGSEIEGWAWDEKGAQPIAKVLFTNQNDRVIGAADGGRPRPDVKAALPEVKTVAVGWKGVAGATSGDVTAIGMTGGGASCVLSSTSL